VIFLNVENVLMDSVLIQMNVCALMVGKVTIALNVYHWLDVKMDNVQTILTLVAVKVNGRELCVTCLFATLLVNMEIVLLLKMVNIYAGVKLDGQMRIATNVNLIGNVPIKEMMPALYLTNVTVQMIHLIPKAYVAH